MSAKRKFTNIVSYIVLIFISIIWLFPFFGILMTSLRSYKDYGGLTNYVIPKHFSLDNYKFLFSNKTKFLQWYGNTLIIAIFVTLLQTLVVVCVAYILSRMRFKLRNLLMRTWLILGMFPGFLTMKIGRAHV